MPRATSNPVELIKRAAVEAVQSSKPAEIRFGTVISAIPLKVQVDQKITLSEKQLILSRNVTNFEIDVTVSTQSIIVSHGHPVTDTFTGGGSAGAIDHNHPINGMKKVMIHNGLVVGDQVLLIRVQGGKRFLIVDRIKPNPVLKGEWL